MSRAAAEHDAPTRGAGLRSLLVVLLAALVPMSVASILIVRRVQAARDGVAAGESPVWLVVGYSVTSVLAAIAMCLAVHALRARRPRALRAAAVILAGEMLWAGWALIVASGPAAIGIADVSSSGF
ncbi:hypothetical protein [Tsukamurella ocularis]|uniref:hypothetical protein n=1 Tax=Tsukamurella ocularis TaxID=1970234 RepID=UPI00216A1AE2|nr:hypothetical protein [Tsukamurella ocularis]MCS3853287.1 hypothetical protein [Tsukamurella ocularis]